MSHLFKRSEALTSQPLADLRSILNLFHSPSLKQMERYDARLVLHDGSVLMSLENSEFRGLPSSSVSFHAKIEGVWRSFSKETFVSSDGIPRLIIIQDDENTPDFIRQIRQYYITLSMRGNAVCSRTIRNRSRILTMDSFPLEGEEVNALIREERETIRRLAEHYHTSSFSGKNTSMYQFLWDITGGDGKLAFKKTAADLSYLSPEPILVPPIFPFQIPLSITTGCARKKRCAMCSLSDVERALPTINSVKKHIEEWAARFGHHLASIQNVFLGRNNLFSASPEFIRECLDFLRSSQIMDKIVSKLPKEIVQELIDRQLPVQFSAFGSPKDVLKYRRSELEELKISGIRHVFLSLETGKDYIRRDILGKDYTAYEVMEAAKNLMAAGIMPHIIFMLGITKSDRTEHVRSTAYVIQLICSLAQEYNDSYWREKWQNPKMPTPVFYASPLDVQHLTDEFRARIGTTPKNPIADLAKIIPLDRRYSLPLSSWDYYYSNNGPGIFSAHMIFTYGQNSVVRIAPYQFSSLLT